MNRNRLAGHTLPQEGRVYGPTGIRKTLGKARCSCGAESPTLSSNKGRQDWHRQHKDEIRRGRSDG